MRFWFFSMNVSFNSFHCIKIQTFSFSAPSTTLLHFHSFWFLLFYGECQWARTCTVTLLVIQAFVVTNKIWKYEIKKINCWIVILLRNRLIFNVDYFMVKPYYIIYGTMITQIRHFENRISTFGRFESSAWLHNAIRCTRPVYSTGLEFYPSGSKFSSLTAKQLVPRNNTA